MHHDLHVPVQAADFLGGLALGEVGHHGQRRARDRATVTVPLQGGEPLPIQRDAQRHLVAARGVDLVRRGIHTARIASAVLLTRVIEDHLLVQLLKTSHGNLST